MRTLRTADTFSSYHPAVNFTYFGLVLVCAMVFMHPVCLAVSLGSALAYGVWLDGAKTVRFSLRFLLPVTALAAVANPLFSHRGATILWYFPSGNPLTLESILYGLAAAGMMAAVMAWFSCYTKVMTSDKFVYLFGKVIPALSLVISMALRFVPKFGAQLRVVVQAQKAVGRSVTDGAKLQRLKNAITILSILLTWSLENAIETADSMRSRGYGLPGRTAFSIYRFDGRDRQAMAWLLFCAAYLLTGGLTGGMAFSYFPTVRPGPVGPVPVSFFVCHLALCLTPVIVNSWEDCKWKRIKSKI